MKRYSGYLVVLGFGVSWALPGYADCQISDPANAVCTADMIAVSDQINLWSFQPPTINTNDDVGYIALLDPNSFSYGAFVSPANGPAAQVFSVNGTTQGSFAGIRVSTLDALRMLPIDDAGNIHGIVEVFDESSFPALGAVRGGASSFDLLADPTSFPAGTFVNPTSSTEILVNGAGFYAYSAEIRADNGATILGDGLFRGDMNGTTELLRTGDAAPDANENYLGFFSSSGTRTLAINSRRDIAFSAVVGGAGITTLNDERLIAESGASFSTLAREGELVVADTPNLTFGATVGSTFSEISYNNQETVAFLARLQEGVAPSDFITGGVGGATDHDGLFIADRQAGVVRVAVRGDSVTGLFDPSRLTGTQLISGLGAGRLNDRGELAFFANAGLVAGDRQTLGLFVYNTEVDTINRIFQSSGATNNEVLTQSDGVGGLTFFPRDAYLNELAINDTGEIVFTSDVITNVSSPNQRGLFLARNGNIDVLALEGATIEVAPNDLRTISTIEFFGGSTADGRPTGLSNNGSIAFTLQFAGGGAGVFVDSLQVVPVTDFLWSGDCGTTNWHAGCGPSNWDDRITGDDAPRAPGSDVADRAFINAANVVISDAPVSLFSISATGSLEVSQSLTLAQNSNIEDLILGADLSIGDDLAVSGANGVWRSGDISGTGRILIRGNSAESGRLIVDAPGEVRLGVGLDVDAIGNFGVDRGTLIIDSPAGININGLEATLTLVGGAIQKGVGSTSLYDIDNTGQLVKSGSGVSTVEAGYRQLSGLALIGGGELVFTGPTLIAADVEVLADAQLTFRGSEAIWSPPTISGEGNITLDGSRVSAVDATMLDLSNGGNLHLLDDSTILGNNNLTLGADTLLRKTGDGDANIEEIRWAGSANVEEGRLLISALALDNTQIAVSSSGELIVDSFVDILGKVRVEGDGLTRISSGSVLEQLNARDTEIQIATNSIWENASAAGNVLPVLGADNAQESTLALVNEGTLTIEAGTSSTFTNLDFRNGRFVSVGSVNDGINPGTFILPSDAVLNLAEFNEFSNSVGSSTLIDGSIVVSGDDSTQFFNGGSMTIAGEITTDPNSAHPTSFDNAGDLFLEGGANVATEIINQAKGVIRMTGGRAEIGNLVQDMRFSNHGSVLLTQGSTLAINAVHPDTLSFALGPEADGLRLRSGRWSLIDSKISYNVGGGISSQAITQIETGVQLFVDNAEIQIGDISNGLEIGGLLSITNQNLDIFPDNPSFFNRIFIDTSGEFVVGPNATIRVLRLLNRGVLRINQGVIDTVLVTNIGSVDIGASPGQGTIKGDFTNSGSLEIEVAGTQAGIDYDQLTVQGVTVFEAGSVINLTLLDPDPTDNIDEIFIPRTGDEFEILVTNELTLANGLDLDSIFNFTNAPSGLRFDVQGFSSDNMFRLMLLAQFGLEPTAVASLQGNSAAVGRYLQQLLLSDVLRGDPRLDAISDLARLETDSLITAASSLHPEIYASAPALAAYERAWALTETFTQQMQLRNRATNKRGVWLSGFGGTSGLDGSGSRGTSEVDNDFQGVLFGGDVPLDDRRSTYLGAFIGTELHDQSIDDRQASQDYDGLTFGVYGGATFGDADVTAMLSYQTGDTEVRRTTIAGNTQSRLRGRYDLESWTAHLGVFWPAAWSNEQFQLRPSTSLNFTQVDRDGFTEQGGSFALTVDEDRYEALRVEAGVVWSAVDERKRFQPQLGIGWRYDVDYENDVAVARLPGLTNASFQAQGVSIPRSMAYLNGSMTWAIRDNLQIYVEYDSAVASGYSSHTGQIGLRMHY